jgi:chromosome segregation ATPase
MFEPIFSGVAGRAEAGLQREGLPYWILWFLLCVIFLLVTFIFLRDKDLRQRLSLSLYGPRRRLNLLTLQARLGREQRKRSALLEDLGRTARECKYRPKKSSVLLNRLAELEGKLRLGREDVKRVSAKIESLQASVRPARRKGQTAAKSIKVERKKLQKILAELAPLERQQDLLLQQLGPMVLAERPGRAAFLPLYAQIDLADETIAEMRRNIDSQGKKILK